MSHRPLGRTGVMVSPLCLGTMMFGAIGNPDRAECTRIIHRALDAGINFIDTADAYSLGESEEIVGLALAGGRRDHVVLATKVFHPMGQDPNERGSSRRWITRAIEGSLRRLGTDHVDLYQVHRPDPTCDIEETLDVLTDLVRAGKVRYAGCSTFPAEEIVEAQWAASRRGGTRFVCEQPPYSMLTRGIERDVLPTALRHGMAVIPWGPLSAGTLSGRHRRGVDAAPSHRDRVRAERGWAIGSGEPAKIAAAQELGALAEAHDLPLVDMALAFVLNHPAVTSAIIGPRTMEQLESQLGAPEVRLSTDLLDAIDQIVPPGTTLSIADVSYEPPGLATAQRRR